MTLSILVFTPEGTIGVADRAYETMEQIYRHYGNCTVAVYDRNDVFGVGYEGAEAYEITTIKRLEW